MNLLTNFLTKGLRYLAAILMVALFCTGCASHIATTSSNPWQPLTLPTTANLFDVAFNSSTHGWVVGSRATMFETTDGGATWKQKKFELGDDLNYRFSSVSFSGSEGWIVGQPSLLLHTTDNGKNWERISLSSKLPGSPERIAALANQSAEMVTDVGAIYQTSDAGKTWKAMVQDAVGVAKSISRSANGQYIAVSATGSFYSTWDPGQDSWMGHNRNSSRRVQNMGFGPDGRLWMLSRGGQIQFSEVNDTESWGDALTPEDNASWGLLDLAYRTPTEIWVAGGSGSLLQSTDGGKTWQKDREVEDVPSNFDKIVFLNANQGFILGQRGTLLRYVSPQKTSA